MQPGNPIARAILPVALLAAVVACEPEAEPADLVLRNGKVVTMDSARPEAGAVAVAEGAIVAVGPDAEMDRHVGPETRVIDLDGRLVIPGFVESHGHFMGMGEARLQLDLMDAATWEEIVSTVARAAEERPDGEWIRGRGWHQEKWDEPPARTVMGFPTHHRLSEVAPEHPVLLTHASGHALIANARAMELAGVGPSTPDPEGGRIVRDEGGRATGVFLDAAEGLVGRAASRARKEASTEERRQRRRRVARLAAEEAVSKGVTSFHDQGAGFGTLALYRELAEAGELPLRLYALVSEDVVTRENAARLDSVRAVGAGGGHLTVRAIGEVSADGALGSHSAWMLEPYADQPDHAGLSVTQVPRIRELASIALAHGYQLAVHAIGDRANRETLDLFAAVFDSAGVEGDSLRWRVEHAQHLHRDDVSRFGEMGVIPSMEGIHACSDAPYVIPRLGEQRAREGAYVWRDLWETGAVVTNGTDAPVEDVDPIASFHCTVTREIVGATGDSTFFPGQSLTREQALRSYTLNGAYAAFQEDRLGSVTPGKAADLVVLSRDIMAVPEDSIPGTRVLYTVVGGDVVYEATGEGGSGE